MKAFRISILMFSALAPSFVFGSVITALSFNSLPSDQGWTLTKFGPHADETEAEIFSVSDGQLLQRTFGNGQNSGTPGSARYDFSTPTTFDSADIISIFFTTAVVRHEQTRQDLSFGGHYFSIVHNEQNAFVGIKPNELSAMSSYFTPTEFDGGLANSYQLILDSSNETFEFYLNGQLVRSGASRELKGEANGFFTMDGTGTANADANLSQFVAVSGTVIPEPSAFGALLGLLALGLAGVRRRK